MKGLTRKKTLKIVVAVILFITSLSIAFITAFGPQIPYFSRAWSHTFIKVEAVCPGDGFASINVTVTNQEGKPLTALATDVQTGGTVDLGVIENNQTVSKTINTTRQQLSAGEVKVKLEWIDRSSSDTKTVKYNAIGCEKVTPTPTPTEKVTPTVTSTPTLTATPSPTPKLGTCGYTPCNETTNPCAAGLTCVQADNGKFYCAKPEYETSCKTNPSGGSCCFAPTNTPTLTTTPNPTKTPTPTPSHSPTPTLTSTPTLTPTATITPSGTITPQPTSTITLTPTLTPTATPTEIIVAKVTNTPTTNPPTAEPTIPSAGSPLPWLILTVPVMLMMIGLLF